MNFSNLFQYFFQSQKKGLLKKLGEAIWIESPQYELQNNAAVIKNESRFVKFEGKIINQIQVNSVEYTTPFDDSLLKGKKISGWIRTGRRHS